MPIFSLLWVSNTPVDPKEIVMYREKVDEVPVPLSRSVLHLFVTSSTSADFLRRGTIECETSYFVYRVILYSDDFNPRFPTTK